MEEVETANGERIGANLFVSTIPTEIYSQLVHFARVLGFPLEPFWTHITRVPMYSPIFSRDYRNPPLRSTAMSNVRFAGNYRTFPSVVSTGTALYSGLECAAATVAE